MATRDIDVSRADLSAFAPIHKGPVCAVSLALEVLEGDELVNTLGALAAGHIQHKRIADKMTEWSGIKVTPESAARHRKHDCSCDRP